jgi:hypothetical protein
MTHAFEATRAIGGLRVSAIWRVPKLAGIIPASADHVGEQLLIPHQLIDGKDALGLPGARGQEREGKA